MTIQIGDRVGSYEVTSVLGEGAFSHTYTAKTAEGRTVVLKFPDPALIGDPGTFERFQRELTIGSKLQHPGVPRAIEMGDSPEGPFLVLEYVEGESFRSYLKRNAPLSVAEALEIATQLAGALAYVHSVGVYHRDLKPENLVIASDSSVHIVDFGIALMEGARRLTWRFLTDAMGTPDYMSPEQIQGKRGDARTDVYALGTMLYEMLTAEVPFAGDNMLAVMNQHLTGVVRPPHELNHAIPPQVEAIILKAIRRDPDERYQDAAGMVYDLEHYQDLDLSRFVFESERTERMPYSDKAIVLLSIGVAIGFVVAVLVIIGVFFLVRSL